MIDTMQLDQPEHNWTFDAMSLVATQVIKHTISLIDWSATKGLVEAVAAGEDAKDIQRLIESATITVSVAESVNR